jgi:hypothetical protein
MGLMSDVAEGYRLLEAHGCQAMLIFGRQLGESLALSSKSGQKAMAFVVNKPPYQLPPDP